MNLTNNEETTMNNDKHTNNFSQSPRYHEDWNDKIGEIYNAEDLAYFAELERKEREEASKPRPYCHDYRKQQYEIEAWGGGGMTRSEERDQRFIEQESFTTKRK